MFKKIFNLKTKLLVNFKCIHSKRHFSATNFCQTSFIESEDNNLKAMFEKDMIIKEDFITEQEEITLLKEIEPYMKKLRYEFDHWDDVRKLRFIYLFWYIYLFIFV